MDKSYKFVAFGGSANDAGEFSIVASPESKTKDYDVVSNLAEQSSPTRPQSIVAFSAETASIIQVSDADSLVEYRFFTLWDEDAWSGLEYASLVESAYETVTEPKVEKKNKSQTCVMNFERELAERNSKMRRIATLRIPAGQEYIFLVDVCHTTHQPDEEPRAIDQTLWNDSSLVEKLPVLKSSTSRDVGLYEIMDGDVHNPVEYRLIFDIYDGVNESA